MIKGLETLCCEGWLITLGLCSLEKRRLWDNFLRKACEKGDAFLFCLVSSGRKCVGMVQSCTWGGLDWTLGNISLLSRWASTETGFLKR